MWLAMVCSAEGAMKRFDRMYLGDNSSELGGAYVGGYSLNANGSAGTEERGSATHHQHVINIPGDFVLGGLFPVHKRSVTSAPCGEIQAQRGIQVGCGLWVVGCGLWVVGCGLWVVGCGLWVV